MTTNRESLYWKSNKEWWRETESGDYELTEKATERAKKSFELWLNS